MAGLLLSTCVVQVDAHYPTTTLRNNLARRHATQWLCDEHEPPNGLGQDHVGQTGDGPRFTR